LALHTPGKHRKRRTKIATTLRPRLSTASTETALIADPSQSWAGRQPSTQTRRDLDAEYRHAGGRDQESCRQTALQKGHKLAVSRHLSPTVANCRQLSPAERVVAVLATEVDEDGHLRHLRQN